MLILDGVTKSFGELAAVADVSLEIGANEYVTMLGPSGSGKSLLLRLIAGFEALDRGRVLLDGVDLATRPAYRRGIGFVSQNFALFPHLSVFDNVAFGLRFREDNPVRNETEVGRRVAEILDLVGLTGLEDRQIGQISGGQKQRVALARTLVVEPRVCLLDEPLGALDANLRTRMTVELRRIRQTMGVTFVHVTGNEFEAMAIGDRLAVLDQGRVIQFDVPGKVYRAPATRQVARFLSCYNIFEAETLEIGSEAGTHAVAVRYDDVDVAADAPAGADAADRMGVSATYVASEYSGSHILYLFRGAGGKTIEVEYHLSIDAPDAFEPGRTYWLTWPREQAVVFDAAGQWIARPGAASVAAASPLPRAEAVTAP